MKTIIVQLFISTHCLINDQYIFEVVCSFFCSLTQLSPDLIDIQLIVMRYFFLQLFELIALGDFPPFCLHFIHLLTQGLLDFLQPLNCPFVPANSPANYNNSHPNSYYQPCNQVPFNCANSFTICILHNPSQPSHILTNLNHIRVTKLHYLNNSVKTFITLTLNSLRLAFEQGHSHVLLSDEQDAVFARCGVAFKVEDGLEVVYRKVVGSLGDVVVDQYTRVDRPVVDEDVF